MKRKGEGALHQCPYCGGYLEFKREELGIERHYETYVCADCGRHFEIIFKAERWREI